MNILKKREYLGHTINFKTRKHFKDKKSHYVSAVSYTHLDVYKRQEEDWVKIKETEAAIEAILFAMGGSVELPRICLLYTSRCV